MRTVRGAVKQALNFALGALGGRFSTDAEIRRQTERYNDVVDQLTEIYRAQLQPALRERVGRTELVRALIGTSVPEAMYLLHHLQDACDSGPGDVVEMGVAQGATSALIANEILEDSDRRLWLYDSFQGLSKPTPEDELINDIAGLGEMGAYAGTMAFPEARVRARVAAVGFPSARTHVVAGFISDRSPTPPQVAFAYLDFDLFDPIARGLSLLHSATRIGSILMVDDYGFLSSGPEKAVAHFLHEHSGNYEILLPPSGAGAFCALRRIG